VNVPVPPWATAAGEAERHAESVRQALGMARRASPVHDAASAFASAANRVDRVYRAVLAIQAAVPAGKGSTRVEGCLEWTTRQWPKSQSHRLRTAWNASQTATGSKSVAIDAFARWLLEVRQSCRAAPAETKA